MSVQQKAGKPLAWVKEVSDHWAGRSEVLKPTPQSQELGDVTTGGDPWAAWEVVDAVGSCMWIAIIEIPGREYLQSRSCAEAAVRLAIDTLGLPLAPETARRIRHTADETRPRLTRFLMQAEGRGLSSGSHFDLPSLRGAPGSDKALLNQTVNLRAWAGAAIQSLVEISRHLPSPTCTSVGLTRCTGSAKAAANRPSLSDLSTRGFASMSWRTVVRPVGS